MDNAVVAEFTLPKKAKQALPLQGYVSAYLPKVL